MFTTFRIIAKGYSRLFAALACCVMLVAAPNVGNATVDYSISGNSPTIGGALDLEFDSASFLALPSQSTLLSALATISSCVIFNTGACTTVRVDPDFESTGRAAIYISDNSSSLTPYWPDADFGAFGTYVSNNVAITMTVSTPTVAEPSSLALLAFGVVGIGVGTRRLHRRDSAGDAPV